VGDFGNNYGDRHNLRLLRVPLASLGPGANTVSAQAINFTTPTKRRLAGA